MGSRLSPALTKAILEALPGTKAEIERKIGRKRNDGTVTRYLNRLLEAGDVEREGNRWARPQLKPPFDDDWTWPLHFDEQARTLFLEKVVSAQRDGVWDDEDRDLLERYVTAVHVGRLARTRIKERAEQTPDDPAAAYNSRGSQGQLVQHPDLKTAREAERDAQVYEDKLLDRHELRFGDGDDEDDGPQAGL